MVNYSQKSSLSDLDKKMLIAFDHYFQDSDDYIANYRRLMDKFMIKNKYESFGTVYWYEGIAKELFYHHDFFEKKYPVLLRKFMRKSIYVIFMPNKEIALQRYIKRAKADTDMHKKRIEMKVNETYSHLTKFISLLTEYKLKYILVDNSIQISYNRLNEFIKSKIEI